MELYSRLLVIIEKQYSQAQAEYPKPRYLPVCDFSSPTLVDLQVTLAVSELEENKSVCRLEKKLDWKTSNLKFHQTFQAPLTRIFIIMTMHTNQHEPNLLGLVAITQPCLDESPD